MRIKEVKKGEAEINRGLVMMSVEGSLIGVESVQEILIDKGWGDTSCMDEIGDGVFALYFIVDRCEVTTFRADFKKAKNSLK